MEQLKQMKEALTHEVSAQINGNLKDADAKELGEAVDMIKDLAEAIYYCTVTEAMEQKEKEGGDTYYYTQKIYHPYEEEMERGRRKPPIYDMYEPMYYTVGNSGRNAGSGNMGNNGGGNPGNGGGSRGYEEWDMPRMRDPREGRSPKSRKMYMESKEMHQDQAKQMKDLEEYIKELSEDITEMIQDATPEEKQMLQQKISVLASKIR